MTKEQIPQDRAIASLHRDVLLQGLNIAERSGSDAGQAIAWLVGLASSLLVLAVANPDRVAAVAAGSYFWLTGSLLVTVAAGVTYRVVALWALNVLRVHLLHMSAWYEGYLTADRVAVADQLSDDWDVPEIVRRIKDNFGADYQFLNEYTVPRDRARQVYIGVYEMHDQHESERVENVNNMLASFMGYRDAAAAKDFFQNTDQQQRHRAWRILALEKAAQVLFTVSSIAFITAMFIVARGLS